MSNKPIISFLIGSGFSIPDEILSVNDLNAKIIDIKEKDITIHSSMYTWFLKGEEDLNRWSREKEIHFIEDLILFYNKEISKGNFDYEIFYDFINKNVEFNNFFKIINTFNNEFNAKHSLSKEDIFYNLDSKLYTFNIYLNQLVAILLNKDEYLNDSSYETYHPYEKFISLLDILSETSTIKIHTLNHDLLLEHICSKTTQLSDKFSNGFTKLGSPFFGKIRKQDKTKDQIIIHRLYDIKISFFNNKFENSISLYNLHGSISNFKIFHKDHNFQRIRIKLFDKYLDEIYYELLENDNFDRIDIIKSIEPDFLTGKTQKIKNYEDEYYQILFNHFKENLENSELLIVIGYGFKDEGINDYILKNYPKGNKIIIFDIEEKEVNWFKHYQVNQYFEKSLIEYSCNELIKFIDLK